MQRIKGAVALLFVLTCLAAGLEKEYKGSIIEVIDGDTYLFRTDDGIFRVRSYGIDAPEGNQPSGRESAAFLSKYLHKDAILKVKSTDRYQRKLGTLFVDGKDINLLEVRKGYAWHYKRYQKDPEYATAQEYARSNKLGIWKLPKPVAPWNWRHAEREEGVFHHR